MATVLTNPTGYTQSAPVTLSGTSVDFLNIPSWVTQINVKYANLSTNGTSIPILQLGDSGGIETTGYDGSVSSISPATSSASITSGLALTTAITAVNSLNGEVSISRVDLASNLWTMSMSGSFQGGSITIQSFASKSLSAALDRLRFTTFGGTETFDAGTASISYQ